MCIIGIGERTSAVNVTAAATWKRSVGVPDDKISIGTVITRIRTVETNSKCKYEKVSRATNSRIEIVQNLDVEPRLFYSTIERKVNMQIC